MTSRERYRNAVNHKEGDRVPIDLGFDLHNGIHEKAYSRLLNYFGISEVIKRYDNIQHLAVINEEVAKKLHSDARYIFSNAPSAYEFKREADTSWLDEWGVRRKTVGLYDESVSAPLAGCGPEDVKNFRMRDPRDKARFAGLKEKAKQLYESTDYALIGGSCGSLFYLSAELVGYQEYMEKLLTDQDVIEKIVDRLLEWEIDFFDAYLTEIGEYIETVWIGDDWGMQNGPLMNPVLFREIFVPRYRVLTKFIKSKAAVKIALHSCGSVYWALNDFAAMGIDIVHPVQGDAINMDNPEKIKEEFGSRLVFYSNLRNQSILPHGTSEEVDKDVKRKIKAFAKGGGYILSGGHNIQADVPPENVLAMINAGLKYGQYPIAD
jgi:uroporphyrinogen decarboxylase